MMRQKARRASDQDPMSVHRGRESRAHESWRPRSRDAAACRPVSSRDVIRVQVKFLITCSIRSSRCFREAHKRRRKLQVLPDGEVPVKRKLLRDVTHVARGFSAPREVEPIHLTRPLVAGRSPQRIRKVTVFPAPFGPRSPKISPGFTEKDVLFHGGEVTELPDEVLHDNDRATSPSDARWLSIGAGFGRRGLRPSRSPA